MLFHTPQFAVFFSALLPVFFAARALGLGPWVLLIFSQVFYAWWDWRFLVLLWLTILLDYVIALRIHQSRDLTHRRLLLALSIAATLSLLGFFKYWNFIIGSVAALGVPDADHLTLESIILPLGISFYSFQSMGYVLDVFRSRERPVRNLVHYATFVCYFPHMIAGPIMRIGRLLPALIKPAELTTDRLLSGLLLFCYGFAAKAMGDVLARLHDPVFARLPEAPPAAVVFAIVSFGFQIYFDFLGYSEMARGISRVLGIELMRNFRAPYTATSFQDFWRRWHISLSEWLRDYLYISLGGNRYGLPARIRNVLITMLLGGLWHGAGWNFLIWGGLQGGYLALNIVVARALGARLPQGRRITWLWSAVGWFITLVGVMYAWLYFRLPTLAEAQQANQKIGAWLSAPAVPEVAWGIVGCVLAFFALDLARRTADDVFPVAVPTVRHALAVGVATGALLVLVVLLVAGTPTQQFIYFQF